MMDTILQTGLSSLNIPEPRKVKAQGFTRWGKNNRYYAVSLGGGDAWVVGDWVTNFSQVLAEQKEISDEEREKLRKEWDKAKRRDDRERRKLWEKTASECAELWGRLEPAFSGHPYLIKKQAEVHDLRITDDGDLAVPMYDAVGKLWNIQRITANGTKLFTKNGRVKGLFYKFGDGRGQDIIICEGWATGETIYRATGRTVLCAFNVGNLESVIAEAGKLKPKSITIAADNDYKGENMPNVGVDEAKRLQEMYGIKIAVPVKHGDKIKIDFNDLAILNGLQAVSHTFKELKI